MDPKPGDAPEGDLSRHPISHDLYSPGFHVPEDVGVERATGKNEENPWL